MTRIGVAVLGPVRILRDDVAIDLGPRRQREVISALALAGGRPVRSAELIQRVWGDEAPPTALATLHGYVAALRRAIEPGRARREPSQVLVTVEDGYQLRVDPDERDEVRFERLLASARHRLEVVPDHLVPRVDRQHREAVETALDEIEDALSLWRGTPYGELVEDPDARAHRIRLEDLHRVALELRAVGRLAVGQHDLVRQDLEARTSEYPLHERWWALRAVALARDSRQAEALAVLDELRTNLVSELGVDPSPPLQVLRTAILRQEPAVTETPVASAPSSPVRRASSQVHTSAWKMVGREHDLHVLRTALEEADHGRPGFAVLTGGAGIGKSRLVEELAHDAAARGWRLAVGQCSQEEGAPPLWPWLSVLETLGATLDEPEPGDDPGGLFRVRAEVARLIRDAASDVPMLLVLEDLHWADPSTLGVLRLLTETISTERLLVVATWRPQPEPHPDLQGVAGALARRHALRRDLDGLSQGPAVALFEDVSGRPLPRHAGAELHQRTQGNAFFIVELARLARSDEREIDEVLGPETLPTAVAEVIGRRLASLPESTVSVLRTAAVVGHSFDLETLGDVTRVGPDELLDAVEPALAAGLLEEDTAEVFHFAHALVADVLRSSGSVTRLARTHRLVAEVLEQRPGREAEVAWHWREAGPRHVDRAWRAAAAAAAAATRVHAYLDAAELLQGALALQQLDDAVTPGDELDLLQQAVDVYRWASMLPELVAAVERSIEVAEAAGDLTRSARAATQTTRRMLWRSAPYGEVNELVVGALRRALGELPETEVELRSRVLASLVLELREEAPIAERQALAQEALGLARASGDRLLLCEILLHVALGTWTPATVLQTLDAAREATALADASGDGLARAMGRTIATIALGELGRPAEMWESLRQARDEAATLKLVYLELNLDEVELAWTAAAGRFAECETLMRNIQDRLTMVSPDDGDNELSLDRHFDTFALRLWQRRPLDALPGVLARVEGGFPMQALAVVALWRAGRHEEAARWFAPDELHELLEQELAFSSPLWCAVAEASLYLGDAELGEHARRRLAPYAGRGSGADGLFFGPVDAFLALAARAAGDGPGAAAYADRALALIDDWGLPPARRWLAELRSAYDF